MIAADTTKIGADADVGLLRQQVIVQLLRESSLSPEDLAAHAKTLIQHGVLTPEVGKEVHVMFHEKGILGQISGLPKDLMPVPKPQKDPSRFEQDFERLELLGRGGFGEVWRVRNRVDQREYAVKAVRFQYEKEGGHLDHPALREAQTWAGFNHPHAVRYHAAWVEVEDEPPVAPHVVDDNLPAALGDAHKSAQKTEQNYTYSTYSGTFENDESNGIVFEPEDSSDVNQPPLEALALGQEREMQILPYVSTAPKAKPKVATLYIQTELAHGGTLQDWLTKRNAAFAPGSDVSAEGKCRWQKEAESIFRGLVTVLADLHSRGIVHRDIKPSNIFLREDRSVCLGDFGLARDLTSNGMIKPLNLFRALAHVPGKQDMLSRGVGTVAYASPEQLTSNSYNFKADVYSLGVVLAELLCPVQTGMERALLLEGLRNRIVPPEANSAYCGASAMVLAMTSPSPDERPSAKDIAVCLAEDLHPRVHVGCNSEYRLRAARKSSKCLPITAAY